MPLILIYYKYYQFYLWYYQYHKDVRLFKRMKNTHLRVMQLRNHKGFISSWTQGRSDAYFSGAPSFITLLKEYIIYVFNK